MQFAGGYVRCSQSYRAIKQIRCRSIGCSILYSGQLDQKQNNDYFVYCYSRKVTDNIITCELTSKVQNHSGETYIAEMIPAMPALLNTWSDSLML